MVSLSTFLQFFLSSDAISAWDIIRLPSITFCFTEFVEALTRHFQPVSLPVITWLIRSHSCSMFASCFCFVSDRQVQLLLRHQPRHLRPTGPIGGVAGRVPARQELRAAQDVAPSVATLLPQAQEGPMGGRSVPNRRCETQ